MADGCRHKWIIDNHNVGTCSLCGEVRQFPVEKSGQVVVLKKGKQKRYRKKGRQYQHLPTVKRHRYYESNRDAIVADLLSMGRAATMTKWKIPSSSLCTLENRWVTDEQRDQIDAATLSQPSQPASAATAAKNGRLPVFPEFSGTWEPSVQLKWLEVYEKLAIKPEGHE